MRVFVTGASGHIGSAVIPELQQAGHQVIGLARSDASAQVIADAGAEVQRGSLDDLDGLREAAAASDGVIHLAFKHEAMRSGDLLGAIEADLRAVGALGDGLLGSGKPLAIASGTLLLAFAGIGRTGTEKDTLEAGPRVDAENAVVALAQRDVRSSVVRLPPTVHSSLDHHGYVPTLIGIARRQGRAAYVGDGENRWPAAHTLDVARVFRLAIERAPAGSRLHAVGDEGIPFRKIAGAIGRQLALPVQGIPAEEAESYFGFLTPFVGVDNPTSSAVTQEALGWQPTHPGLIEDLEAGHYFEQSAGVVK